MGRGYSQYCPIAHALGLVGERWALLVVRELQHGPLRYTDLLERLEGCSTNVLAARLRELESQGVLRRERLAPPAAATVYALTPAGEALRPVLRELAWWGIGLLGPPPADLVFDDEGLARALRTALPGSLDGVVELRVGGAVAHAGPDGVTAGAAHAPEAAVETDATGLYRLLVEHDASTANVRGDAEAIGRLLATLPAPAVLPAG
ncbi:MAG: winged helix-turn-helix transcriptional regulator [Gaiella sp.]